MGREPTPEEIRSQQQHQHDSEQNMMAEIIGITRELFLPLALEEIRDAFSAPRKINRDKLRKQAIACRNVAPVLLETFGAITIHDAAFQELVDTSATV